MERTPYKGIVKITCENKKDCPRKVRDNVEAACIDCKHAIIEIIDLKGDVIKSIKGKEIGKEIVKSPAKKIKQNKVKEELTNGRKYDADTR